LIRELEMVSSRCKTFFGGEGSDRALPFLHVSTQIPPWNSISGQGLNSHSPQEMVGGD
jgi:hypothetical protein